MIVPKVVVKLAMVGRRLACCTVLEQQVERVLSNHSKNDHMLYETSRALEHH